MKAQQVSGLLRDARRFILSHKRAIEIAPLQVYASALVFSPTHSLIRKLFEKEEPNWITLKSSVESDWNACLQTLEGHSGSVSSVAFSHDSALLASASGDGTVRIWRTDTGKCVQSAEIGVTARRLSFQLGDRELLTDVGALVISDVNPTTSACFSAEALNHRSGYGISTDNCWITWHGDNLLWLAKQVRPACSAISRSMVVIGCSSGRVLFISLSSDKLPAVLQHA
jgi:WD40 repeat protein